MGQTSGKIFDCVKEEMEKENKNGKTKNGKVVVIDPGHGRWSGKSGR